MPPASSLSCAAVDPTRPDAAAAPAGCFHCGLEIPRQANFSASVAGSQRRFCCAGCQAIAQAIDGGGLSAYYEHREAHSARTDSQDTGSFAIYDDPLIAAPFVRELGEHEREASLLVEGMHCTACVWLNEEHWRRQPGVTLAEVNFATRRGRIRWDPAVTRLSSLLAATNAIGYRATPYDPRRADDLARSERRDLLARLAVAMLGMMQVMMYAIPVYLTQDGVASEWDALMRWASLLLTVPVVLYSALPFFRGAWRDLRARQVGMDVPVALGIAAAFVASVVATVLDRGDVYFDSVTMFVAFLLAGRYLELRARQSAVSAAEHLAKELPAVANRLDEGGRLEQVAALKLRPGDRVLVRPGEPIPCDGRVIAGESSVAEALLTGESRPVSKRPGSEVLAGALNAGNPLTVEVQAVGEGTRLAGIVRLLEQALRVKPRLAELADLAARRFVLLLLVIAAATAAGWLWYDPPRALAVTVAVLVVSCPCALSLATPAALAATTGALARSGLLITRGGAVEALARVTHVVFDKTGTLTTGDLRLVVIHPLRGMDVDLLLAIASALETSSEHPVARALVAADPAAQPLPGAQIENTAGAGITARLGSKIYRLGRADWAVDVYGGRPLPLPEGCDAAGIAVLFADDEGPLGWFVFADTPRPGVAEVLAELRQGGVEPMMCSGDRTPTVTAWADRFGITQRRGDMAPEDKLAAIQTLQAGGSVVAMVGDGINDGPALARANVAVALGSGAAIAQAGADAVLESGDLGVLARAIRHARKTLIVMRQNLAWAMLYNVVAIPAAASGWLTPWAAGLGMSISSLVVVLNAMRLRRA